MTISLRTSLTLLVVFTGASHALAQRGQGPPPAQPRDTRETAAAAPVGTASISGTVGIVGTGQAAKRARVTLSVPNGGGSRSATTDDSGRFTFTSLLAGRYSLSASKPGHVSISYGQTKPGRPGTPIQLTDGQRFEARLQIYKGSVITGTVLDENGEAIPGTQVRVLRYVMQSGQRTVQQSGNASTDDRGIYRAYGLQPGDYIVSAIPRNTGDPNDARQLQEAFAEVQQRLAAYAGTDDQQARDLALRASMLKAQLPEKEEPATGYAPVYYPGTTAAAQAGLVAVAPGEEKAGVDFQLQRVAVARIDGLVINSTGQPLQNVQITLTSTGNPVPGLDMNGTRVDGEGRFQLPNVPPGQYTLTAVSNTNGPPMPPTMAGPGAISVQRPDPVRLWAAADLAVDGHNVSNVILTLQPGLTVAGRVVFDGTSQPPADLTRVRVSLSPVDIPGVPRPPTPQTAGRVDSAGRFTVTSVVPGTYRLSASSPSNGPGNGTGWSVESSIVDGQDSLDFPVDIKPGVNVSNAVITMTDRQAELSGTIVNSRGEPAPDFTIVLYSSDERYWTPNSRRIRTTRPGTDGRFTFANVPPGEYRLAPLVDAEPGSWFDPAFLRQIDSGSVRVPIGEGEKRVQELRVGG